MDQQDDTAKLMQTKFSSCRGVSFELKPSPGSPFAIATHQAEPDPSMAASGGHWVWLPWSSNHDISNPNSKNPNSKIFSMSQFQRSLRRATSSHFCDLDDDDNSDNEDNEEFAVTCVVDVESQTLCTSEQKDVACKRSTSVKKAKHAGSPYSRLAIILFDQGMFTVYKRLFAVCFTLNMVALVLAATGHFPYAKQRAAVFAMGNILALTLCRSEAVLRVIFWLVVKLFGLPWVPLIVKTGMTSLLQSLGGIHSGCGVSSLAWLVYALVRALEHHNVTPPEIIGVVSAILGLIGLSCMAAFPFVRHLHHNVFERTHRFAGWSALALLWAFVVLSVGYDPATESYAHLTGANLVKRQELWLTSAITFFTFLPWLTVCRVPVTVTAPSGHASIITFQGGIKAGLLGRISRSPLSEWHAFGIISDGKDTLMMLAGAVGDFTRRLIADPPSQLWVRGVHFAGLPYLTNLYQRVMFVATGSGICVFMSFLLRPSAAEVSLVWVAKGVEENFGKEIKEKVMNSKNLEGRVVVHDTAVIGRPDVAQMAVSAARRWNAEVVVVTSNPQGSRDVVRGCKKAGIPAFGPIWDS